MAKLWFWRMMQAYEAGSPLAVRAPVELARRHLLDHDGRAAHPAWETGTVIHPVTVVARGHRRAVRVSVEIVHRHHLAGLHADGDQVHPVAPQMADDLLRNVAPRGVRVLPRAEQHLGAVYVADAAHHALVHQQLADRGG